MPKDTPIRWENAELIKILSYINNNIDMWCTNHLNACLKAIEATNNNKRDAKAVYNKIHSLIKAMDEFLKTGKKAQTCSIIWEETKIHDLLPFSPDLIEKLYNEKCQQIAETRTRLTKIAESAKSEFDMVNFQIPFQLDSVETNCNDKVHQITLLRTELIEMIEKANNKYNELKAFQ
ncbi:2416_t:CDS:2 [Rhizophagus irregularis]|nr:2416_t:CDS:2 [Rhizophagus irregularis]